MDNVPGGEIEAVGEEVSSSLPVKVVVGLTEVPATVTPITANDALGQLRRVFPDIDPQSATLLLSLIWVESARGKLVQYNAGNIAAAENYGGAAWRPPWYNDDGNLSPRLKSLHEAMLKGRAPRAFRAYPTLDQGFQDFAAQLERNFPEVLQAAQTGDARFFVDALSVKYSQDYNAAHVPTFEKLQREFAPLTGADIHQSTLFPPETSKPTKKAAQGASGLLVGLVLAYFVLKGKNRGPSFI